EPDRHATGVVCGRDFVPDGTIEAATVRDGDPCPACEPGALAIRSGIEIGHTFQLGRRYSDAFELDALGPDGRPVRILMGCYGLGVSRLMAAVVEQYPDAAGLVWPEELAPCDVHVVPTGQPQLSAAEELAGQPERRGRRVRLDDRAGGTAGVSVPGAGRLSVGGIGGLGRRRAEGYMERRRWASARREGVPLGEGGDRLGRPAGHRGGR